MKQGIFLSFDVGGTYIKAGGVRLDGTIVPESLIQLEAHANDEAPRIFTAFTDHIHMLVQRLPASERGPILGIGYAFPGPFDYENGISWIQGLNKFASIYGMNLAEELRNRILSDDKLMRVFASDWKMAFENDAYCFALGEARYGEAFGAQKAVCLTIGTGLGSAFLEHGRIVKQREGLPENGWLYSLPWQKGIADEFISRRGVLTLAKELGISEGSRDVHELAAAAAQGSQAELELFVRFGERMGIILAETLRQFQPEVVVLGGQIAKSSALFAPAMEKVLAASGVPCKVKPSQRTLERTLQGIRTLFS